jgi:hypothetical protein
MSKSIKWTQAIRSLRQQFKVPNTAQTRTRHKGQVATTSPFTIYLDGNLQSRVAAHVLAGYTPTVGDLVFVDNVDGDLVVIHKYAS